MGSDGVGLKALLLLLGFMDSFYHLLWMDPGGSGNLTEGA